MGALNDNLIARRTANQLDQHFIVFFKERVFHGPPRWHDWTDAGPAARHYVDVCGPVPGDYHRDGGGGETDRDPILGREPGVARAIDTAHDSTPLFGPEPSFLTYCNKPDCRCREFWIEDENHNKSADPAEFTRRMKRHLKLMAENKGQPGQDEGTAAERSGLPTCAACGQLRVAAPVIQPKNCWIYVLTQAGAGATLEPIYAIQIGDNDQALGTLMRLHPGRGQPAVETFPGYLQMPHPMPDPENLLWHFFLSPCELGPQALDLLKRLPSLQGQYDRARSQAHGGGWGGTLQPWATTVVRKFSANQIRDGEEPIALINPFRRAGWIAHHDLGKILRAQQSLLGDADEQAKAFICSVLDQAVGPRGFDPTAERDPYHLVTRDLSHLAEARLVHSVGSHGPDAVRGWLNRYKQALDYLTGEVQGACSRLVAVLRYSLAHRVAELGCQEQHAASGVPVSPLTVGLVHWACVLRELACAPSGRAYLRYLALHPDNADRIPQANVLNGRDVVRGTAVFDRDRARGLLVALLAELLPVLVKSRSNPAQRLVETLNRIEIPARLLRVAAGTEEAAGTEGARAGEVAPDMVVGASGSVASLGSHVFEHALKHAGTVEDTEAAERGLRDVENVQMLCDLFSLFKGFKSFWEEEEEEATPAERIGSLRERVGAPAEAAKFLMEQTQRYVKASRVSESELQLLEHLEHVEEHGGMEALRVSQYELLISSRSVRVIRAMEMGVRVIEGPVSLVLGGMDLLKETREIAGADERGESAVAAGHYLAAIGAAGTCVTALAETYALLEGAEVAAWVGPVGWIAAAAAIGATVVIYYFSESDLQLFASHCFLGRQYGGNRQIPIGQRFSTPATEAWMGRMSWAQLRFQGNGGASRDRFQAQRLALLRLLSGFEMYYSHAGNLNGDAGYLCDIYPGLLTPTAVFEVVVFFYHDRDRGETEIYHARVTPNAEANGDGSGPIRFAVHRTGETVSRITINARPNFFNYAAGTGRQDYWYRIGVRLHLDGNDSRFVPVSPLEYPEHVEEGRAEAREADSSPWENGAGGEGGEEENGEKWLQFDTRTDLDFPIMGGRIQWRRASTEA